MLRLSSARRHSERSRGIKVAEDLVKYCGRVDGWSNPVVYPTNIVNFSIFPVSDQKTHFLLLPIVGCNLYYAYYNISNGSYLTGSIPDFL